MMGYRSTKADNDVYLSKRIKVQDGTPYYEMVVAYVNDVIFISENPKEFMQKLSELYKLKDGYSVPKTYLGTDLSKTSAGWLLSTQSYLANVLDER